MKFAELLRHMPDFVGANGSDEDTIVNCENALGVRFSLDYREYLKEIGLAYFDGRELTGISKTSRLNVVDVTMNERELNESVPTDLYVIEETGYDGVVIWQATSGEVYQTMPNKQPQKICESLVDYITR